MQPGKPGRSSSVVATDVAYWKQVRAAAHVTGLIGGAVDNDSGEPTWTEEDEAAILFDDDDGEES